MRMMDDTCAGSMSVASETPLGIWATLLMTIRHRRNRSRVARLENLSDQELKDIGLTRIELRAAMQESRFFEDPSTRLTLAVKNRQDL